MDAMHDLGGMQGFGAIDRTGEDSYVFKYDWEGRMHGIAKTMATAPDWSIDRFRHARECIDPVRYLQLSYYDQWHWAHAVMLAEAGAVTADELASGRATTPALSTLSAPKQAAAAADWLRRPVPSWRPEPAPAAFAVGDRVRARTLHSRGHTRLPRYVRGHVGMVVAVRGVHVLPDAHAHGDMERAEAVYAVRFRSADLWQEAAGSRDSVSLDLWESYLEPA